MSDKTPKTRTGSQVTVGADYEGNLPPNTSGNWTQRIKAMRKHSTVKFCRMLYIAPILLTELAVMGESDEAKEILEAGLLPHADTLRYAFAEGLFDWGWQPFEQVIGYDTERKINVLKRVKVLNPSRTQIRIDPKTSEFAGFINTGDDGTEVKLNAKQSILVSSDATQYNLYGTPEIESLEDDYLESVASRKDLRRYLRKIAGSHWVVRFPPGKTEYAKNNGELTDNAIIAQDILAALQSNGKVAFPVGSKENTDDGEWDIELKETTGGQTPFLDDLKATDVRIIRGTGIPERTAFEGQYGTKAEAGEHKNFALAAIELKLRVALSWLNRTATQPLLKMNGFPSDSAEIGIAPLSESNRTLLETVYSSMLSGAVDGDVDYETVREQLGIPQKPEDENQLRGESE